MALTSIFLTSLYTSAVVAINEAFATDALYNFIIDGTLSIPLTPDVSEEEQE